MKALVLAGGSGTRLRPITHTNAKQLVPLANKPILTYALEAIAAAGISEVGIVVGETHQAIRAAVGDGADWGISVTYIQQDAPSGLAHAVLIADEFLGDDSFVMYLGDNLVVGGITDLVEGFETDDADAAVLLARVEDPRQFGVAELDAAGNLVGLQEKPDDPRSDLALVGVYLFGPTIHDAVRAIKPSARGELEITDAIAWLVENGHTVRSRILETPWIDTGKKEDLLTANRIVMERLESHVIGFVDESSDLRGAVVIAEDARIESSEIVGPAIIGRGAHVIRSRIGPNTSVEAGCVIEDSVVQSSILLERSRITGVRCITESLIGQDTRITGRGGAGTAGTFRFVLGDHSEVDLT